jgi:hypothetical protein
MTWKDIFSKKDIPVAQKWMPEDGLFNPLKAYCGGYIEVTGVGRDNRTYLITEIAEYTRKLAGEEVKFTDYHIEDKGEIRIVRVNPKEDGGNDMLLLELHYEGEFDQGIQDALRMSELYQDTDKGKITYYQMSAGRDGYLSHIRFATHVNRTDIRDREVKYWDYTRKPDANLGELTGDDIFLFVNIDQKYGYITMWEGTKVTSGELNIYSTKV